MKTIYLVRKMNRYGSAPTNIRAFESMADAEDLVDVFKRAGMEDMEVIPLELEVALDARVRFPSVSAAYVPDQVFQPNVSVSKAELP